MDSKTPTAPTLIRHRYDDDMIVPARGSVIKLRLPQVVSGPPGSTINSSAVTGATRHNYHSVLVRFAIPDSVNRVIQISVWPIPSYSTAKPSPTEWLDQQPQLIRDSNLPFPCIQEPDPRPTPLAFGEPLNAGGFRDRRPSWVLLNSQDFQLPFHKAWKSFDPPVVVPEAEVARIDPYHHHLLTSASPSHPIVSLILTPPPSAAEHNLFSRLFSRVIYDVESCSSNDTEDGDSDDEDVYDYLRMVASGSKVLTDLVVVHDREVAKQRRDGVLMWIGQTVEEDSV